MAFSDLILVAVRHGNVEIFANWSAKIRVVSFITEESRRQRPSYRSFWFELLSINLARDLASWTLLLGVIHWFSIDYCALNI